VVARLNRRSVGFARRIQAWLAAHAGAPVGTVAASLRSAVRPFATADRSLPVLVAVIVAAASMLALLPTETTGATGSTSGRGQDVRLAVNGGLARTADAFAAPEADGIAGMYVGEDTSFTPVVIPEDVQTAARAATAGDDPGSFLDDGTLVTGYAPETDVADGSDLIRRYKVKSGDTLVMIARQFDVSMMTLWWANKLKAKDDLHIGQVLRIPPVSGLVVTVKDSDTLESLAAQYKVRAEKVLELNGLEDPTLVVGQVLVLPGAKGAPIPTPKPTPKPAAKPRATSSGSGGGSRSVSKPRSGGANYTGGQFRWPVVGGGNYISQYAHAGHIALDIAADYGSPIVAVAGGRVVFAGWKSNGGGWQVWISHGGGLYTTYNHMAGVSVGSGQSVGRGQRIGRLGSSGWATGPHLHFEVWRGGMPWSGGYQVNPMRYF
jgi:murein DD-endopeptidase MepM/ murein hydrolase activator NlpD